MCSLSRIAAVLIIAFSLAACSTVQVGHDFEIGTFQAKIERGVTTQNQVRAWLGEPIGVGISQDLSGGRLDEWTYYFAEGKLTDLSSSKMKYLQVKFDNQGIVRAYDWSNSKK